MFLEELTPVLKDLVQQPVAFLGGFASGLLRLNLNDDPVKTWLNQQLGTPATDGRATSGQTQNGNGKQGPQSISID